MEFRLEKISTDILIIGAGAAGLRAAVSAAQTGQKTLIVSKLPPGLGTSTLMSGGAMAGYSEEGETEAHRAATLAAGRNFNQADLLEVFTSEAPARLRELVDWGLDSKAQGGGLYSYGKAGSLGRGMIDCIWSKASSLGARCLSGLVVWHLALDRRGAEALAYHPGRSGWLSLRAKCIVLATGGASALYLHHDNPQRMMGEGYALALGAGARLQDMEFAQFFPLSLAEPKKPRHLFPPSLELLGPLKNDLGEEIHEKYGLKELPAALKARDKLSQALFREMSQGHPVSIDLREVTKEDWCRDPFAVHMWDLLAIRCQALERPLLVAPAAHFFIGGVSIDPDCASSVPGLFACGEVAGGVHGANRRGGNALTETIVFGARAGASAGRWAGNMPHPPEQSIVGDLSGLLPGPGGPGDAKRAGELKKRLKEVMWHEAGIIRSRESLDRADLELTRIQEEADGLGLGAEPKKVHQVLELKLGLKTARLIVHSARRRQESRGVAFREDFPEPDDRNWLKRSYVQANENGVPEWTFGPA